MRDIRGDLQDRAGLLEEQINAHEAQFDKLLDQLKQEHDARLEDLKGEFEAVNRLIEVELRRLRRPRPPRRRCLRASPCSTTRSHQAAQHAAHQPAPAAACVTAGHRPRRTAQPELPLSDFLVRKLNEVGAMSRDDLRRLSLQEGYFADADTAERGVHTALAHRGEGRPHPAVAERQLRAGHRDRHHPAAPGDLISV